MIRLFVLATACVLTLWGCASLPRPELDSARKAMAKAYASQAPQFAPEQYNSADQALKNAEDLINRGEYDLAREILPHAEDLAHRSIHAARQEQTRLEREEALKRAALEQIRKRQEEARKAAAIPPPQPPQVIKETKPPPPPPPPPPITEYTVGDGETLWTIASQKKIYGDSFLWPLLYRANRDQIKDPRQIYPGQELSVPRNYSVIEKEEARESARNSDIFPIDILLKTPPEGERHPDAP